MFKCLQQHGTCRAWKLWNEYLSHVRPLLAAVTLSKLELLYNVVSLGYDAVWMDTDIVSPSVCKLCHCPRQHQLGLHQQAICACSRTHCCKIQTPAPQPELTSACMPMLTFE